VNDGIAHILDYALEAENNHLMTLLLQPRLVPELTVSGRGRGIGGDNIALEILLYLLPVKDHLLFEFAMELSPKKQEFQLSQKAKNNRHSVLLCIL